MSSDPVRRAYVLDDEAGVRAFVSHVLAANSFHAVQFASTMPLLTKLKLEPPEVLVLDLALGHSDAVEVIRHLKILSYKGKVLLISGTADAGTLSDIQQIGLRHGLAMLPTLRKPFRASDLKARLEAEPEVRDALPELRSTDGTVVDLGEALQCGWLELWYQPKIDIQSMLLCGAEALARVRHPEHGVISPAGFLPPANDPLYQPLSKFVLGQAMADWGRFADVGLRLKLAVNIPVSVIHAPDFISVLREALPQDPKFPGLIVEVTEDEIIRNADLVREIATQLKLYNVWLSIDDFGSAYSSLSRLFDLPSVELKLDRSFVSNCHADQLKRVVCQTVIDLAHRFNASVCAEGVEDAQELTALREMGCDTAQGYYLGKPMPPALFVERLRDLMNTAAKRAEPPNSELKAARIA